MLTTCGVCCRYLVLPHYEWTLKGYFATHSSLTLSEREVLLLLVQICNALVHLQRHHVVHCDFKVGGGWVCWMGGA